MRWYVALVVCLLLTAHTAFAKPKLAIAPLDGDEDDRVAGVIAEMLSDDAEIIDTGATKKAMKKLDLSGELAVKDIKKLRKKLDADVLVQGKVEKEGKKKKLSLAVSPKGKKTQRFALEFKSAAADSFRKELRDEIGKRIGAGEAEPDDDDGDKVEKPPKDKEVADDGEVVKKKKKKKKRGDDDPGEEPGVSAARHPATQVAIRANVGATFEIRRLSFTSASPAMAPPRVGTAAASVRFEAELYPLATEKLSGAAGLGIYGDFDKTVGLSIQAPGGGTAPVSQGHFSVGARYRVSAGSSSYAFGVGYAKRKYVIDRTAAQVDAVDTNYSEIVPGAVARFGAGAKLGVFLDLRVPLLLDAGPISSGANYGKASIIAFETAAGLDIALAKSYALRLAGEFTQVGFKFTGNGAQASARMVSAAADRQFGLAATFAVTY